MNETNADSRLISHVMVDHAPAVKSPVAGLGKKWLTFWNYISLPIGGVFGLLISFGVPGYGLVIGLIAIFQLTVAYGLHHRKLWAWRGNWVIIFLIWINGAIPYSFSLISVDFWGAFTVLLVVFGCVWMWPNYVYWRKRKELFWP